MHAMGVAHRDIKPSNILLEDPGRAFPVKLGDFDLASDLPYEFKKGDNPPLLKSRCGTPFYMAPEVVQCYKRVEGATYDLRADMWSLGVLVYRMIYGKRPFLGRCNVHANPRTKCFECTANLHEHILSGTWSFPEVEFEVSDAAKDLISRLLVVDPDMRMTAKEVHAHPFITNPNTVQGPGSPPDSPSK